MRNLQLITRGREGLLHQYIAMNLFDSQLSKHAKHGHELDATVLKTAKSHLETSARLNATSDADVDDLIERLSNAKGSGDYAGVAKELRERLTRIDVAADLETPVTIKAPSLNDVPKQPGPEIGR
jgi:predicted nucleotidyltransferase